MRILVRVRDRVRVRVWVRARPSVDGVDMAITDVTSISSNGITTFKIGCEQTRVHCKRREWPHLVENGLRLGMG